MTTANEEAERIALTSDCKTQIIKWRNAASDFALLTGAAREAVLIVKDMELWRDKGFQSFSEWLEKECDITPRWGFALLSAAKVVRELEETAASSKTLAPLIHKRNVEKLRALPDAAIKKLDTLPPAQAAKAALRAIEASEGEVPTTADVAEQVQKFKVARRDKSVPFDNHPVLIAIDNEWTSLQKLIPVMDLKPKMIYTKLREAIEKVL